jgi:DNA helicase-2/ATP-dependent DNA helicase PcrA
MDFSTRYHLLNDAQKQAVDLIEGPVMVIAGPGTGKTELLSMRAANILQKTDTLPQSILCLTFTESGAVAMRERLLQIIGPAAYKIAIHTFHSFGTEIMNQNGQFFYHGSHFRPADGLTSYETLRTIFDGLDYDNPLASKMNGEYTYLADTLQSISELKRSGLTSDELLAILDVNDRVIDTVEAPLKDVFSTRLSKLTITQLEPLIDTIKAADGKINIPGIAPLSDILAESLSLAISEALEGGSTKPITAWRNRWMKKDDKNQFVLKVRQSAIKLRAVSYIYYQYLLRMQEAKLFDFDDMILRVVHAMEVFPELRFNLQEQYQYIMVDEFQDTNLAQMRILYNLTKNEVNDDQPNILVVGDDDQAIYSFQGADVGNINAFLELYPSTKQITLTDNYRSSDAILNHARSIITQGTERLENILPNLNKTLLPHHTPPSTQASIVELPTVTNERAWLADDIAAKIAAGTPAHSIAVLARWHREIKELLPYFAKANIPVNYERQQNVLESEPIRLIEHIAHIIIAIFEERHDDADSLMPELLTHPAFAFPPLRIWQLSLSAQASHKRWLEVMSVSPDLSPLHEWLVTLAHTLTYTPLERMIDYIIGRELLTESYTSPINTYYFSAAKLKDSPQTYIEYLEALRTIRTKLIEYQPDETPILQNMIEFMRLHRELGSSIMNIYTTNTNDGIQLMSAHKSKGLEFDNVYIVGAVDTTWGERVRSRSRLISYPPNLPLSPAGDTYDERLRLFFVATTRARNNLTVTYATENNVGKETLRASFLANNTWPTIKPTLKLQQSAIQPSELAWYQPIISPIEPDMKAALLPTLERYKLSATHVNAFLDITHDGPQGFLINNLLRFPQTRTPSASYGSAIHIALQRAHSHLVATGKPRPQEDTLHDYEEALRAHHLNSKDFQHYLQKGSAVLSMYLDTKQETFHPHQKAELSFAGQSVFIGKAHLTGTLDLVDITDNVLTITDYKTGRPVRSWQGRDNYEKIKLYKYKQQLMFYCLLIKNSRDYAKYHVEKTVIQFVEPTPQHEIITLEATFSHEDLDEFARLIQVIWERITTLNLPDISQYQANYQGILAFEHDLLENMSK